MNNKDVRMARPGVTYKEISQAAAQIMGQGKAPTIEQIRHILGTGSSSTIAMHLRTWKTQQQRLDSSPTKEQLPHELTAMMKGLWQRVLAHAETRVDTIQKSTESFLSQFKVELAELKRENARLQRQCEQLKTERDSLLLVEGRLKKIEAVLKKQKR